MSGAAKSCYCGTCPTCAAAGSLAPRKALNFRHAAIRERLLSEIATAEVDFSRPLAAFGTRDPADPSIALIDAFAGSLHVLAVNAARLGDDGTILRSEDRDAVVELVRLLGYEPRPALSATTDLSFTVATVPGAAAEVTVPKGTQVASVPLKDELPQIFETDLDLDARAEWNRIAASSAKRAPPVDINTLSVAISGTASPVRPGDRILIPMSKSAPPQWLSAQVNKVTRRTDVVPVRTLIELVNGRALDALADDWTAASGSLIILGVRSAAFGASAPDLKLMSDQVRGTQIETKMIAVAKLAELPLDWLGFQLGGGGTSDGGWVDLDAIYTDALPGRLVLFTRGATQSGTAQAGRITDCDEHSRTDFGLSARVTSIDVKGIDLGNKPEFGFRNFVRESAIYLETTREELFRTPIDAEAASSATPDRIRFDGSFTLPAAKKVILSGEQWMGAPDVTGPVIGETASVRQTLDAPADAANGLIQGTMVLFEAPLQNSYRSVTLALLGNAVSASNGVTPPRPAQLLGAAATSLDASQPIGSGDASRDIPRFQLSGFPLTYVPAPNPRGFAPALEVRVGERLYQEQPFLYGLSTADRAYTVRSRNGVEEIQFAGRLPSGNYNVTALYRTGAGRAGNLAAGRLTTMMTPVLGITGAQQPVAAEGGSEAESIDDLRTAGPDSVRTLDRVVSLDDYAAYARTYRGVGKALATELMKGMRMIVVVTIATTELEDPSSDTIEQLGAALAAASPPGRSVIVQGFSDLAVSLTIALVIDPAFRRSDVEAAVRAAIAAAFGRPARQFGQALNRSAVIAAAQGVDGVVGASLTTFSASGTPPETDGRLLCPLPEIAAGALTKAGLLSIDAGDVNFAEMQP